MKRTILALLITLLASGVALGDVVQMNEGQYQPPGGWNIVSAVSPIDLDHYNYYYWGNKDFSSTPQAVNIVFHSVYDWTVERDILQVYVKDGNDGLSGWKTAGVDQEYLSRPDWSQWAAVGTWSDPAGGGKPKYDVVFSITDQNILSMMTGANGFQIAIDPDCHYWGKNITLEAVPQEKVPEPFMVLFLGIGLAGLGVYRKIKR